uniref:Uncharacterized protein n=1 Tax=Heterorhabditis bacteriophora TaxID=37862 RepID=A0A1I7X5I5_HETBA
MRRMNMSRYRRSRSRSPVLRGPRSVVSKALTVNMLDASSLEAVKHCDGDRKLARDFDDADDRKNGRFRDEDGDKPVQRLIDPTAVPKGKSYFDVGLYIYI